MENRMFYVIFAVLFLASCTTTEEMRRERIVNDLSLKMTTSRSQIEQSHQTASSNAIRIQRLEEQITKLSGLLEDVVHHQSESERGIEERVSNVEKEMAKILEAFAEQKEYIKQVVSTLERLEKKVADFTVRKKKVGKVKKTKLSEYQEALALFRSNKRKKAEVLLLELSKSNKITAAQKNRVLHTLGIIAFDKRKYDQAVVYFSKIYAKFPKSSFAPDCLYYIGRSLVKLGEAKDGKASFEELIKKFPKSKRISHVKKLMKGL